jgi:hypothetical protein
MVRIVQSSVAKQSAFQPACNGRGFSILPMNPIARADGIFLNFLT